MTTATELITRLMQEQDFVPPSLGEPPESAYLKIAKCMATMSIKLAWMERLIAAESPEERSDILRRMDLKLAEIEQELACK